MILLPQKVAYRGTISSLRISSVGGTAFLDACAALVPYADGNHLVEIYDASGRMLRGYLAAAGDGEDLTELITVEADRTLASDTGFWSKSSGDVTIADGKASLNAVSTNYGIYHAPLGTDTGVLYKVGFEVVSLAAGSVKAIVRASNAPFYTTTGAKSAYLTQDLTTGVFGFVAAGNGTTASMDNLSIAQVTGPSADGCTIVSAKGGATANWAYKDAAFTYNAATNYVVVRKAR